MPPPREGLEVRPLLREPLDVALPLDHPLAGRDRVSPADVIDEDWIVALVAEAASYAV